MAVLVDLEKREINASIRDLAAGLQDLPRGLGLLGQARAVLGQRVHQAYRAEREAQDPDFRAEVEVRLERSVDGFRARLRGRVDGLLCEDGGLVVEEAKSVVLSGAELSRLPLEAFPDFALQLRLYALALAEQHPDARLRARLVLVSLLDGTRRSLEVEPFPEATRQRLDDLLRQAVALAEQHRERALRLAAAADRLVFPYPDPRPHQAEVIEAFAAGLRSGRPVLATAPTGIGKTVAALMAGLGHALRLPTRLVFLTSRTTQRELVARTFEDICQAAQLAPGDLRCLTLRAKEDLCPPGHMLCHPDACPFLEEFQARLARSKALDQLLAPVFRIDPDQVRAVGEAHRLCPFALCRALLPCVELVIGDFNHLFDPGVMLEELFAEGQPGPVVIIDEAHNLFDRARKTWSPYVTRAELSGLLAELESGALLAEADKTDQLELAGLVSGVDGPALFEGLAGLLRAVDAAVLDAQAAGASEGAPGLDDCCPVEPDRARWAALGEQAVEGLVPYLLYNRTHGLVRPQDPLVDLLVRLQRLAEVVRLPAREQIPYVGGREAPAGTGFGSLCVNPAPKLAERHLRATGSLAMSATLSPLGYYADVLGFAGMNPHTTSLPSPFPAENLGVFAATGPSTTFRDRDQTVDQVARIVEQVVASRPGRYAAFFPSFRYLSQVQAALRLPAGQIHAQVPGLSPPVRARLLDRFRRAPPPALLLAAMGGVFGEGVDLPGEELIGAIVIGPGLPQVGFERAVMQRYFQEEYEQGFAYAMLFPGMQRVIQAAGRVIRGPDDQGLIVLVGRRYANPEVLSCLPEHWYRHRPEELICEDLPVALGEFWRQAEGGIR